MADLAENIQMEPQDDNILKPRVRKAPSFSVEQRAAMADRMRKVNQARIEKARSKPENAVAEEARKQSEELKAAKQAELDAEIERLKLEAAKVPKLAKIPKARKPRVDKGVAELDALVEKVKERKQPVPADETDIESEDDYVPPPPRVSRARKTIAVPAPVKVVAKFL